MKPRIKIAPTPGIKFNKKAINRLYEKIYSKTMNRLESSSEVDFSENHNLIQKIVHNEVISKLRSYGFAVQ